MKKGGGTKCAEEGERENEVMVVMVIEEKGGER